MRIYEERDWVITYENTDINDFCNCSNRNDAKFTVKKPEIRVFFVSPIRFLAFSDVFMNSPAQLVALHRYFQSVETNPVFYFLFNPSKHEKGVPPLNGALRFFKFPRLRPLVILIIIMLI